MPTEIDRPPGWTREESPVPPVNHELDDPFSESDDVSHWQNFDEFDDDNFNNNAQDNKMIRWLVEVQKLIRWLTNSVNYTIISLGC